MAITYPLSLPTEPSFRTSTFRLERAVGVSVSPFTGREQVYLHQGAWWEAELTLPPMSKAQARAWIAFMVSCRGRSGTFLMGDPDGASPQGAGAQPGSIPYAAGGQTGTSIASYGWKPSAYAMRAGDYFQLGTGASARLHMCVQDSPTDPSGGTFLTFEPPLREATTVNQPIYIDNPRGVFRLVSKAEWGVDEMSRFGITLAVREAL